MQQFAIRKVEKVKLQIAQCSTVFKISRFFAGPIQRSSSTNSSQQSAKIRYLQVDKIVKIYQICQKAEGTWATMQRF